MRIPFLICLFLIAIPLSAKSQSPELCDSLFECAQLAVEQAQQAKTSADQAKTAASVATPSGAVMAFNLRNCPNGWSAFDKGVDRFIVGSGGKYALLSEGGRADIKADGAHEHPVRGGRAPGGGRFGNDRSDDSWATGSAGKHNHGGNNLPPYISLLLCEKD